MALYDAGEMRILDGPVPALIASRYAESRRVRWPMLGAVVLFHVVLAATLDLTGLLPSRRASSELKVIQLSPEMAPPPPLVEANLPQQVVPEAPVLREDPRPVTPILDAPPPIVSAQVPALAVIAQPVAPPSEPAPAGPVRVADLDAKAVTVIAPKYPRESRRKREQGTVVLSVTLAADGGVDTIALARSSGFERLDKAALDAVRRWRWSPTLRAGVAVAVKGTVEIPFVLQG